MSWASFFALSISLFWSIELMQTPMGNALVPEEESALEVLRNSFNLSKWTDDPCGAAVSWITCSNNFVSELNLQGQNLTGIIPAEIAGLRHTRNLILSGNSLSGSIPDLSNMTNLELLALDRNNLTGGIPASIFNHSTLITLNLSYNPLGGSIPAVTVLTSLTLLDLTQTQVTGTIPDSIQGLSQLVTLRLGDNPQLNGSVDVLDQPYSLKIFNGSYCAFSGRLPDVGHAGGMQLLDLQMNDFSGTIPLALFQHESLQWLYLNNNPKLSGQIPDMTLLVDIIDFFANDCNLSGPLRDGFFSSNLKLEQLGLWNNRLTSFPTDLRALTSLQVIDVHNNNITGLLPDLASSTNQTKSKVLTWLTFSNNHFSGRIPSSWYKLTYLKGINLSSNRFSGDIPEELGDLTNLEILDLSNNQFSGDIPGTLAELTNLKTLLLDNNRFTGIPESLVNRTDVTISYDNNPGIQVLFRKKPGISTGTIIGVIVGACAIIGILAVAIILYKKKRRKKSNTYQISKEDMPKSIEGFTLKEIKVMTEKFKTSIGKGGFGSVYHGKLSNGKEVAVKVRETDSNQGTEQFLNEVRLLGRLHHRNLVTLVGYCVESQQQMLVYEFMSQGTLHDHLYHQGPGSKNLRTESNDSSTREALGWKKRLNIALNAAKGLEYLHKDCNPPVIHRDVKASNILLTNKLQARLGDLGISKQAPDNDGDKGFNKSGVSTVIKGTFGYLDPEYYTRRKLTTKSDVYSFGMVLLEMITAKKPQTQMFPQSDATNLIDWVQHAVNLDRLDSVVDPALQGEYDKEVMLRVAKMALSCTLPSGRERPEMGDVVRILTQALHTEGDCVDTSSSTQEIIPLSTEKESLISRASTSNVSLQ